jgi:hypothetical protein
LPFRGPACAPEPAPFELPAADALVDSAAVAMRVAALHGGDAARVGQVLLSLAFDETGWPYREDVIEYTTPPAVADSVWRLVSSLRREQAEPAAPWGVRLRIEVGDPIQMAVNRRLLCRPMARNPEMRAAMQTYTPPGVRIRRGAREQTVFVATHVSEFGTVTATRVVRGDLAGPALEREIYVHLRQFLFRPATIDGEPTGAWVEIPVVIRRPL